MVNLRRGGVLDTQGPGELTPREEQILRMRFGSEQETDCTLEEIGKLFAVTREYSQNRGEGAAQAASNWCSRDFAGFMARG